MTLKGTPLMINGVLYFTAPDHVWAVDARTGREIWHHTWQAKGGITIGNRGAAVLGDALFFDHAGLQPRVAQRQGRDRALAQADLRPRSVSTTGPWRR